MCGCGAPAIMRWSIGCSRRSVPRVLSERVAFDHRIDGAVRGEIAFEQSEVRDGEKRAGETARLFEQIADRARAALEPGKRDVRQEDTLVGLDTDPGERRVDLLVQGVERLERRDSGP